MQENEFGKELSYETLPGMGDCVALTICGSALFAVSRYALTIYDIAEDPYHPHRLGSLEGLCCCRQLVVSGGVAYITARNYGLWIVDVSDLTAPRLLRRYDTLELATGIDISGNILFVTLRIYGVLILDVSNPLEPVYLSQIGTYEAQSVVYRDQKLYVGDWGNGELTIIDVSDCRKPFVQSRTRLDGYGDGLCLAGNLCYCSTGHDAFFGPPEEQPGRGRGMEIFDVSDPCAPKKVGGFKFRRFLRRENDYWTVRVSGQTAYCADSHNGFYILDVSQPEAPRATGFLRLPPYRQTWEAFNADPLDDCCAGLAVGNGVVYLAGLTSGIHLVRDAAARINSHVESPLSLSSMPKSGYTPAGLLNFQPGGLVHRVAAFGDRLYIAASHQGLIRAEISESGLKEERRWRFPCVYDVAIAGDRMFCVEDICTLGIYRIAAGTEPELIHRMNFDRESPLQHIHVYRGGTLLVFSGCGGQVSFLDVSDAEHPVLIHREGIDGVLYTDMMPNAALGDILPVNWHCGGLGWFDLSCRPPRMLCRGLPAMGNQMDGLEVAHDKLFTPLSPTVLGVSDASRMGEPFLPIPLEGASPEFPLAGIPTACGNLLAFADRRYGKVTTLTYEDGKAKVVPERCYAIAGRNCDRVVFVDGRMVIPGGYTGVWMECVRR